MSENKQRTATQRIEDLETSLVGLYSVTNNMARDLVMLKEALGLLGKKSDAIVKAVNIGGEITDQRLSELMIESNVEEMKKTVEAALAEGKLSVSESAGESAYLVVRQVDAEGKVINRRLQFGLAAVPEQIKEKFKDAKAGDVLDLGDSIKTEVLEVYTINPPSNPDAPSAPVVETSPAESAAEVPTQA